MGGRGPGAPPDSAHSASATVSTPSGPGALACFSAQPGSERPGLSPFTEAVPTHTRPDVILLVEDDDVLRQLVLGSLEREEYWVLCARDGEEAWNLFSEHAPLIRLVITEVVLSGMDGLEADRSVSASQPGPPNPLYGQRGPTVRGRASGRGAYPQLVSDEAFRSRVPPLEGTGGVEELNGCPWWHATRRRRPPATGSHLFPMADEVEGICAGGLHADDLP